VYIMFWIMMLYDCYPAIFKWPNRFVYMFTFWPIRISKTSVDIMF
jgi:hypothetical protein